MQQIKRKLAALTVTLMATAMIAIPTMAAESAGGSGDNIYGDADGKNNAGSGTTLADTSLINSDDGAWEVSFYCKDQFRGAFLLGDTANMMTAAGGNTDVLMQTKWHYSNGVRLSNGDSDSTPIRLQDSPKPVPKYGDTAAVLDWGTEPDVMEDMVLTNLVNASTMGRGNMSNSEKDEIVQMIRDASTATPEQIKEKMDSGEWFEFFVTMRPVMLTFQKGKYATGDGFAINGMKYQYNNREQQYSEFSTIGSDNWFYICDRMNNVFHNNEYNPGDYGQPHTWPVKTTSWTGVNRLEGKISRLNGPEGNYAIFYFSPAGKKNPPPPPDTSITTGKFEDLRIYEYEIMGAPYTDFDTKRKSNIFADNVKKITITENTEQEVMTRIHRIWDVKGCDQKECHSSSCCTHWVEGKPAGPDGKGGTSGHYKHTHDDDDCDGTIEANEKCGRDYHFTWDGDPVGKMDLTDLTSESNTMGPTDRANFPGVKNPNQYQMTRSGGVMDLEFYQPANVFTQWTWNNGTTTKQDINASNTGNITSSRREATPKGASPEPFSTPFSESFNSHRFGKYDKDSPMGTVGEKGILPLAGYMMETTGNRMYSSFMQQRSLDLRVRWKLNETDKNNRKNMYSGTWEKGAAEKGLDKTWGHGGDGGTSTADSDLVWNNKWSWTRSGCKIVQSKYEEGCDIAHKISEPDDDHADPEGLGNAQEDVTADSIQTPRAVFGRSFKVEPTKEGKSLEELQTKWKYYIRKNEYGNDRLTMAIPSTIFEFSPTYKMYADYELDAHRDKDSQTDTWMLAADYDKVQFMDMIDFNLVQGESVVRAPWSRDFEDTNAVDPNDKTKINVMKSGQAYTVETKNSKLVITAIVHYWDEGFWNINDTVPGSMAPATTPEEVAAKQTAAADNRIVEAYKQSIQEFFNSLTDKNFGFYTNLVGGTSDGSLLRKYATLSPQVFGGAAYNHAAYGTTMKVPDVATADYPKLRLKPDLLTGYVKNYKRMNGPTLQTAASGEEYWRLNANWGIWDSPQAAGDTEWTMRERHGFIPDLSAYDSEEILQSVMVVDNWYMEDYEGIKVAVIKAEIELPAIKSEPATVYEKLSDFRTSMNQWSPKMIHPNVKQDSMGVIGSGDAVLIPEGTIAAGTFLEMPAFTVYPDGYTNGGSDLTNWTVCYKPFRFGLRGSAFDN